MCSGVEECVFHVLVMFICLPQIGICIKEGICVIFHLSLFPFIDPFPP